MSEIFQAVFLGVVEGITEFLPISSTAHLLISKRLLDASTLSYDLFVVTIQIGAVFAIVFNHRYEMAKLFRFNETNIKIWRSLIISMIPTILVGGIIGGTLIDFSNDENQIIELIAFALIWGGLILLLVEKKLPQPQSSKNIELPILPVTSALFIGLCQVIAFIPGISRSAASIVGGLLTGLNRQTATKYSFYLAIPTLIGAASYSTIRHIHQITSEDLSLFFIGLTVSTIVSSLSIRWLLSYVGSHRFTSFAIYRLIAGCLILIMDWSGLL